VRPERIGSDGIGDRRVEHRGETGDLLDVLLVHDVGRVQPGLGPGGRTVVDLHHQRRTGGQRLVHDGLAGQRHHRIGRDASTVVVVSSESGRWWTVGADEVVSASTVVEGGHGGPGLGVSASTAARGDEGHGRAAATRGRRRPPAKGIHVVIRAP
jgi:hypothetical protein